MNYYPIKNKYEDNIHIKMSQNYNFIILLITVVAFPFALKIIISGRCEKKN
jgi:hypothetical protein